MQLHAYHIVRLVVDAKDDLRVVFEPQCKFGPEFAKLLGRCCCRVAAVSDDLISKFSTLIIARVRFVWHSRCQRTVVMKDRYVPSK